ncbi:MAG: hypothetical protein J6P48_02210 [Oscillospiraceae bacterium]|nr:hypothetical protein [Oscillospiraceae bacterium]
MMEKRLKTAAFILLLLLCAGSAACGKSKKEEEPPKTEIEMPAAVQETEPEPIVLLSAEGERVELAPETEVLELDGNRFVRGLAENREKLPLLKTIRFSDGSDFSVRDVEILREAFPSVVIEYKVFLFGKEVPHDTEELDLSELTKEETVQAAVELGKLERLHAVTLMKADADPEDPALIKQSFSGPVFLSELSLEDVGILEERLPDTRIDYRFVLFGKVLSTADERIEYVRERHIGDEGLNHFRAILPFMKELNYLKLDDCGTTSACMASLRDDFPEIKVVWRVWFGNYGLCGDGTYATYNCLTDTEKIWATGTLRDRSTEDLKYCTDVRYIDIGHNSITDIGFVNYMPKLEVAVFSITYIDDISPLANCPDLEYLELFRTLVTDLSPLENCKNLKHLYFYDEARIGAADITPLYGLDRLERLYCTVAESAADQKEEFMRLHPECECDFSWVFIGLNHWRLRDGDYVERYKLLREQFGYDTFDMSK